MTRIGRLAGQRIRSTRPERIRSSVPAIERRRRFFRYLPGSLATCSSERAGRAANLCAGNYFKSAQPVRVATLARHISSASCILIASRSLRSASPLRERLLRFSEQSFVPGFSQRSAISFDSPTDSIALALSPITDRSLRAGTGSRNSDRE